MGPESNNPKTSKINFRELIISNQIEEAKAQIVPLAEELSLHPITVRDCVKFNLRSKIDIYNNYVFIVWHYFHPGNVIPIELQWIVKPDQIVLITAAKPPTKQTWEQYFISNYNEIRSLNEAIIQILNICSHDAENYLLNIEYKIVKIEKEILDNSTHPKEIITLKRSIRRYEFILASSISIFNQLSKSLNLSVDESFAARNVANHLQRLSENAKELQLELASLLDVYWGINSISANKQMQRLTAIATIFVPVSLWSGIFGMNFEHMPFKEKWFFILGIFLIVATFLGVLIYLYKRGILRKKEETNSLLGTNGRKRII